MIDRRGKLAIAAGRLLVLLLRPRWPHMILANCGLLLRCGPRLNAALATVVAHIGHVRVVDDGRVVVNVPHIRNVYVIHATVVVKLAVPPVAAVVAISVISVAVVDPAIETDLGSPVTRVPEIRILIPSPIAGGPEITDFGRLHPSARHPVVAIVVVVGPIAGRPNPPGIGTRGLFVDR